jgi:hypothetical protein
MNVQQNEVRRGGLRVGRSPLQEGQRGLAVADKTEMVGKRDIP